MGEWNGNGNCIARPFVLGGKTTENQQKVSDILQNDRMVESVGFLVCFAQRNACQLHDNVETNATREL